jgi:hypothetical protein
MLTSNFANFGFDGCDFAEWELYAAFGPVEYPAQNFLSRVIYAVALQ